MYVVSTDSSTTPEIVLKHYSQTKLSQPYIYLKACKIVLNAAISQKKKKKSRVVNVFIVKTKSVQSGFSSKTGAILKFLCYICILIKYKVNIIAHQHKFIVFINTSWYKNKLRYSSNNVKGYVMLYKQYIMQFSLPM